MTYPTATMTAPYIGNTELTVEDMESDRFQAAGFVVREAARRPSSWRSEDSLAGALRDQLSVRSLRGHQQRSREHAIHTPTVTASRAAHATAAAQEGA